MNNEHAIQAPGDEAFATLEASFVDMATQTEEVAPCGCIINRDENAVDKSISKLEDPLQRLIETSEFKPRVPTTPPGQNYSNSRS